MDNDKALASEITTLDLDEDGSELPDNKDGTRNNRPGMGPARILYRKDGMSTRVLTSKEEKVLKRVEIAAGTRREKGDNGKDMPLLEVLKNLRHNEGVPLSARLAKSTKTMGYTHPRTRDEGECQVPPTWGVMAATPKTSVTATPEGVGVFARMGYIRPKM